MQSGMLPIFGRKELIYAGIFVNFTSPTQTCSLERITDSYLKQKKAMAPRSCGECDQPGI